MDFGTVTLNDLDEIRALQPGGWPDIVPEFIYYIRKDFCHPVKVTLHDRIIGIGATIQFENTCWLAHIIVDKDYRKRGIGTGITEKLLDDRKNNPVDAFLLIATESGLPVYEKTGFRSIAEYKYLKRDRAWKDFKISPNIFPYQNEFYSGILELDLIITGENRKSLLHDHLANAFVFLENYSIRGFYLPGLGEGPIIAETTGAGLELMKVKYSNMDKAVLPSDNHEGIAFLKKNGFSETDTRGTRMIIGKDIAWKPHCVFSRIGGNFG